MIAPMDLQLVKNDGPVARPPSRPPEGPAGLERARGSARVAFAVEREETRIEALYQAGAVKVRFPRARAGAPLEAVLLNTAGGVTGGDRLDYAVSVGDKGQVVITSQAAERIYRRSAGVASITTDLTVGEGATLEWLPQETIVFDRSGLSRRLTADVAMTGSLLAVEAIVLGRAAMGETVRSVTLHDSWRIRRAGRLVFADGLKMEGDSTAVLSGGATGRGAAALATLVLAAPDAEARLEAARTALADGPCEAGASAWNGVLVARLVAPGGQALRAGLVKLIETLRGRQVPRVWQC
jgi:urease accessory protein